MRFPRRRTEKARSPAGPAAGTAPDDPARPVVRVLIPPAPARPHSVDLLQCGHHYRASCAALAAVGAVIINDRRSGGTIVAEYELGDPVPSAAAPER